MEIVHALNRSKSHRCHDLFSPLIGPMYTKQNVWGLYKHGSQFKLVPNNIPYNKPVSRKLVSGFFAWNPSEEILLLVHYLFSEVLSEKVVISKIKWYDPAIPLLGIYPEKTIIQKDICTPMFIAALFTIARSWKQPKCPSTNEWIKKIWYIYTMEYYTAIKRNETGSFVEMWMDLETVIQSEVSQKEKSKYHILTHICGI